MENQFTIAKHNFNNYERYNKYDVNATSFVYISI